MPLTEGLLAFAVLAVLQFVIAWLAQRVSPVEAAIKATPRVLLLDGRIDQAALLDERVTVEEIKSAVRKGGLGDLRDVAVVILETDGSFSVIPGGSAGDRSAFPSKREHGGA